MNTNSAVYVFGGTGYIGSEIIQRLNVLEIENSIVGRQKTSKCFIDLDDYDSNCLAHFKSGDYFICLAAISSPEVCSENYDYAHLVNVLNTKKLIEGLLDRGVNVLFASSDVVYGRTESPVDETDDINPQFEYAVMKAEVEDSFMAHPNFNVMRLSYVWSTGDKFTKYLIDSHLNMNVVDVFDPFIRSVISLDNVVEYVVHYVSNIGNIPSVVNLCGPEFISRVQLVHEVSKHISLDYTVSKPSDDFFKYRPDQILMKSVYLEGILGRKADLISDVIRHKFLTFKTGV